VLFNTDDDPFTRKVTGRGGLDLGCPRSSENAQRLPKKGTLIFQMH